MVTFFFGCWVHVTRSQRRSLHDLQRVDKKVTNWITWHVSCRRVFWVFGDGGSQLNWQVPKNLHDRRRWRKSWKYGGDWMWINPLTGWWFQTFFLIFTPILGKIPNLTDIFQRGWNHQLDFLVSFTKTPYAWKQNPSSKGRPMGRAPSSWRLLIHNSTRKVACCVSVSVFDSMFLTCPHSVWHIFTYTLESF